MYKSFKQFMEELEKSIEENKPLDEYAYKAGYLEFVLIIVIEERDLLREELDIKKKLNFH